MELRFFVINFPRKRRFPLDLEIPTPIQTGLTKRSEALVSCHDAQRTVLVIHVD